MSEPAGQLEPFPISVVADVMCPWCFVGKRRLERALERLPHLETTVSWWPFLLDPTIPPGGMDRGEYLQKKFGSADGGEMYLALREVGREEGIEFAFDAIERSPNTVDAHRLIYWAGDPATQNAIVERLFRLYFLEGADIGDPDVLAGAAQAVGMDVEDIRAKLADDRDRDKILKMAEEMTRAGVNAVPSFVLGGKRAVVGAQPVDLLTEQIELAEEEFRNGPE
ncbi:MAG: DsbA family oxidoreductase [Dichotomicrobium sp.]